jgi:hypothetical protein
MNTLNSFLFNCNPNFIYFYRRLELSLQLPTNRVSTIFSISTAVLSPKLDVPLINTLVLYVDTLDLFDKRSESQKSVYDETGILINAKS